MKKAILGFIGGTVFGAAAVTILGMFLCEYVEGLPEEKPADESEDYAN